MSEFSSKQYSKDEVDRIIRRALKMKKEDSVNHQELLDTAREFGIDPQTLESAIEKDKDNTIIHMQHTHTPKIISWGYL